VVIMLIASFMLLMSDASVRPDRSEPILSASGAFAAGASQGALLARARRHLPAHPPQLLFRLSISTGQGEIGLRAFDCMS